MLHDPERLTSLEPQFMWRMTIVSQDIGYEVRWQHCHVGGLMCDCPEEVYNHLAADDLVTLSDALLDSCWLTRLGLERH